MNSGPWIEVLEVFADHLPAVWVALLLLTLVGFPISISVVAASAILLRSLSPIHSFLLIELVMVSAMSTHYLIGRSVGHPLLERMPGKVQNIAHSFDQMPLIAILAIRGFPGFPFILQNLTSGILRIPFGLFLLVSIPVNSLYVIAFSGLSQGVMQLDSGWLLLAVGLLVSLRLIAHVLRKCLRLGEETQ